MFSFLRADGSSSVGMWTLEMRNPRPEGEGGREWGLLTPEMEHVRRLHHRLFGHRGGCQADAVLFLGGVDQDAAHLMAPDVEHQFPDLVSTMRGLLVRVLAMMFTWRIGRSVMPSVEPPT